MAAFLLLVQPVRSGVAVNMTTLSDHFLNKNRLKVGNSSMLGSELNSIDASILLLVPPVRSEVHAIFQVVISHAGSRGGSQISPFHANFANVRDIPSDPLAFLFFEFTGFIFMIAPAGILVERSGVSC